ncbi:tetratricopeptide repeat protein [Azospirillum thermophilum]|uniref:tetratricopeptide repeat protein n=1 Tax=Azospirillum thermophilum TaxID=2202148 RepID=UPI001FEABF75|nr:tetratricopeptide repeat protein [Azospirillum thermophilum]
MDMIEQSLAVATEHHRAGRTAEAERLYREVLTLSPGHPDALHLLGVLALQSGRAEEAADLIGQAAAGDPGSTLFHANLGHALHAAGRTREAALSFARALTQLTNQGESWSTMGALAGLIRRYDDETRRAAAAELDAGYAMSDVMRRQSLLFTLSGDIEHYRKLVQAALAEPMRFSIPSLHYAYWGMAMQLFQGRPARATSAASSTATICASTACWWTRRRAATPSPAASSASSRATPSARWRSSPTRCWAPATSRRWTPSTSPAACRTSRAARW